MQSLEILALVSTKDEALGLEDWNHDGCSCK
jgi:hypothetical protein